MSDMDGSASDSESGASNQRSVLKGTKTIQGNDDVKSKTAREASTSSGNNVISRKLEEYATVLLANVDNQDFSAASGFQQIIKHTKGDPECISEPWKSIYIGEMDISEYTNAHNLTRYSCERLVHLASLPKNKGRYTMDFVWMLVKKKAHRAVVARPTIILAPGQTVPVDQDNEESDNDVGNAEDRGDPKDSLESPEPNAPIKAKPSRVNTLSVPVPKPRDLELQGKTETTKTAPKMKASKEKTHQTEKREKIEVREAVSGGEKKVRSVPAKVKDLGVGAEVTEDIKYSKANKTKNPLEPTNKKPLTSSEQAAQPRAQVIQALQGRGEEMIHQTKRTQPAVKAPQQSATASKLEVKKTPKEIKISPSYVGDRKETVSPEEGESGDREGEMKKPPPPKEEKKGTKRPYQVESKPANKVNQSDEKSKSRRKKGIEIGSPDNTERNEPVSADGESGDEDGNGEFTKPPPPKEQKKGIKRPFQAESEQPAKAVKSDGKSNPIEKLKAKGESRVDEVAKYEEPASEEEAEEEELNQEEGEDYSN